VQGGERHRRPRFLDGCIQPSRQPGRVGFGVPDQQQSAASPWSPANKTLG